MITELGITEQNLRYFLGRFITGERSAEAICKIVLFRKLGCSPATVKALLSGDNEVYREVLNRKPRRKDSQKAAALEGLRGVALKDISCDLCSELLHKSGLIERALPCDRFFLGRLTDTGNLLWFLGVSLNELLFRHNHGWASLAAACLWGMIFVLIVITANSLSDLLRFRRMPCDWRKK